jgi:fumarate hydratase class II
MPGKVNPVMSEMLIQVCAQVIGNDNAITFGGAYGNFELNVMMPMIAHNLLQSIQLLTSGSRVFARRCVAGLQANQARCEGMIEQSLAMCTALAPVLGYDAAAAIAKKAFQSGKTVRQVALETSGLTAERIAELLDPASQVDGAEVGGR